MSANFEQTASRGAFIGFATPVRHYDSNGNSTDIMAVIDRGVERWDKSAEVVTRGDEVSFFTPDVVPGRGSFLLDENGQLYRIGNRVEDDAWISTYLITPVASNFDNTLEASMEFSL